MVAEKQSRAPVLTVSWNRWFYQGTCNVRCKVWCSWLLQVMVLVLMHVNVQSFQCGLLTMLTLLVTFEPLSSTRQASWWVCLWFSVPGIWPTVLFICLSLPDSLMVKAIYINNCQNKSIASSHSFLPFQNALAISLPCV